MVFDLVTVKSIEEVDIEEWDSLSRSLFSSSNWFRVVEESKIIKTKPYYIRVYCNGELSAFASAFIQYDELYSNLSQGLLGTFNWLSPFKLNPCLLCYSPMSWGRGIEIKNTYKAYSAEIASLIIEEMRCICHANRVKQYGFANIQDKDFLLQEILLKQGFVSCFTSYNVYMDITWPDFESYRKSLSRNARKTVRKEIEKINEMGIKISMSKTIDRHEIVPLIENTFLKYNSGENKLTDRFFYVLEKHLGDQIMVISATLNESIFSTCLCFVTENAIELYKSGQDEDKSRENFVFFSTAVYEPIRYAISSGIERINIGVGTYKYKILRGGKTTSNKVYLKSTSRLKQTVCNYVVPVLSTIKKNKHDAMMP